MVVVFVDWNVEFEEFEDTVDPFDIAAQCHYSGEFVARVLIVWAHQHSEEEGEVAMHALQSWFDHYASYVVYDLIVEPLAMV